MPNEQTLFFLSPSLLHVEFSHRLSIVLTIALKNDENSYQTKFSFLSSRTRITANYHRVKCTSVKFSSIRSSRDRILSYCTRAAAITPPSPGESRRYYSSRSIFYIRLTQISQVAHRLFIRSSPNLFSEVNT